MQNCRYFEQNVFRIVFRGDVLPFLRTWQSVLPVSQTGIAGTCPFSDVDRVAAWMVIEFI